MRRVWSATGHDTGLRFETPVDFHRLTPETMARVTEWLAGAAGR